VRFVATNRRRRLPSTQSGVAGKVFATFVRIVERRERNIGKKTLELLTKFYFE
jgi:hypothetical protein